MKQIFVQICCFFFVLFNLTSAGSNDKYLPLRDAKITHKVFFDVKIGDEEPIRVIMGLFGEDLPITVANFVALCLGNHNDKITNKTLTYKNTIFHRIIPNFMVQGGDVVHGTGAGSMSIYGKKFNDEKFLFKHEEPGVLSMANAGADTNGSQFFITTVPTPWLDGVHVVFGRVLNYDDLVVTKIESVGSSSGTPQKTVTIVNSGVL